MNRRPIVNGMVLATVIVLSSLAAVYAQPRPQGRPQNPESRKAGEVQKTIQIWMLHRMRERWELTDEQSLKLMELMKQRRAEESALHGRQKEIRGRLHDLAEAPNATDAEYRGAIQDWEALENDKRNLHERFPIPGCGSRRADRNRLSAVPVPFGGLQRLHPGLDGIPRRGTGSRSGPARLCRLCTPRGRGHELLGHLPAPAPRQDRA